MHNLKLCHENINPHLRLVETPMNSNTKEFKSSEEASYRRFVRQMIRKSDLTRAQKDITVFLVNLWFHHKSGSKKYIHPSVEMIGKKSNVGRWSVQTCLRLLRDSKALAPIKHQNGGRNKAAQYEFNMIYLLKLCCPELHDVNQLPDWAIYISELNDNFHLLEEVNFTKISDRKGLGKGLGKNENMDEKRARKTSPVYKLIYVKTIEPTQNNFQLSSNGSETPTEEDDG